jgi:hypothetical protein
MTPLLAEAMFSGSAYRCEIDLLYGKLAAGSQLTDADLRRALADALERLATQNPERAAGAG